VATQGIGARVPRKEDARLLAGRGSFVADMVLPRQREVAFLRSPIAHGRIAQVGKPAGYESSVFVRDDIADIADIVACNTVPGYRVSKCPPLAHSKVRFVGEPVAMCVAPTRALAEDLCARVQLDLEELPVLVDAHRARTDASVRVHEEWPDNCFLTLNYESGFASESRDAPVVVTREMSLARQAMVPLEGKAVLAYWDERSDQLMIYTSTQVPHIIRAGIAKFLGIPARAGARRVT
jgi:carbon-monoxide dehydrogenase large subunit